mgnify:CR=1 FL=1
MVNEFEIKKQLCDIGKRIYNRNMVAANDGNISVKLNDCLLYTSDAADE